MQNKGRLKKLVFYTQLMPHKTHTEEPVEINKGKGLAPQYHVQSGSHQNGLHRQPNTLIRRIASIRKHIYPKSTLGRPKITAAATSARHNTAHRRSCKTETEQPHTHTSSSSPQHPHDTSNRPDTKHWPASCSAFLSHQEQKGGRLLAAPPCS